MTLRMEFKWGFDGSSGHSKYNQSGTSNPDEDDQIMLTSRAPIRMTLGNKVVWQNPSCSSTRFCRPMKLQFLKETSSVLKNERHYWQKQIDGLEETLIALTGLQVRVSSRLHLTMLDGKAVNVITDTASMQRCALCGATPSVMNDIENVRQLPVQEDNFRFGLSTLHAWIRMFECIIHIAYRMELKKWRVTNDEEKAAFITKKAQVKKQFWERMSLHVDEPRSGGKGSSNTGNTARRAFAQESVFAEVTGVDEELIHRMGIILQTLSAEYAINIQAFRAYCDETADLYVRLYRWYPMPAAVHKILVHGPAVVNSLLLPIGTLSEEAQESRHKDVRAYRLHHARKDSRVHNMADVFGYMLVTSDPIISSSSASRRLKKRAQNAKTLSKDAVNLLSADVT